MGRDQKTQPDKCPNDLHADLDGTLRIQNFGGHDCAVLSEGIGQDGREFQLREVVAFCDHLRFLFSGQIRPQGEIR